MKDADIQDICQKLDGFENVDKYSDSGSLLATTTLKGTRDWRGESDDILGRQLVPVPNYLEDGNAVRKLILSLDKQMQMAVLKNLDCGFFDGWYDQQVLRVMLAPARDLAIAIVKAHDLWFSRMKIIDASKLMRVTSGIGWTQIEPFVMASVPNLPSDEPQAQRHVIVWLEHAASLDHAKRLLLRPKPVSRFQTLADYTSLPYQKMGKTNIFEATCDQYPPGTELAMVTVCSPLFPGILFGVIEADRV